MDKYLKEKIDDLEVKDNFNLINQHIDYSKYVVDKKRNLKLIIRRTVRFSFLGLLVFFVTLILVNSRSISSKFEEPKRYRVEKSSEALNMSDYELKNKKKIDGFIDKLEIFSNKLTVSVFNDMLEKGELDLSSPNNYCISPVSIYMGLAMAIECSNGETRQQMLDAVGVTYEEVVEFTTYLYDMTNDEKKMISFGGNKTMYFEHLANSIWVDEEATLKPVGLERLATLFHASTYQAPFTKNIKSASKGVNDYIEKMTSGLVNPNMTYDPLTTFMLVNTYYLKDVWDEEGEKLDLTTEEYSFKEYDKDLENKRLLIGHYKNGKQFETDTYRSFYTSTYYGNKITFIVPKDEYNVLDIYNQETLNTVCNTKYIYNNDETHEEYFTRCFFPKYEASFNGDIKETLINNFGIRDLFIDADLTNIFDDSYIEAYCLGYNHQTKLKVDDIGLEGAAATEIPTFGAKAEGPPYKPVYMDFIVDREFVFIIRDSFNNILFSGVITEL